MSHNDPTKRHEFVLLFDVKDGNPNGDPDSGNMPRVDPETMHGLVTDVALKRKIRDYLHVTKQTSIFIQSEKALNTLIEDAANEKGAEKAKKTVNKDVQREMCRRYYDIRMFGAVLSTGDFNAGQVRGPVQFTFARSIDPVLPMDVSITRQARTTTDRMETGTTEMGRKPIVPYGLYRAHGYFNPFLAEVTGVSSEDLKDFWDAVVNLFELDRSAARGEMSMRGVGVFTHENKKGNAAAHRLFNLIRVPTVGTARDFAVYQVIAPRSGSLGAYGFPGVTLNWLVKPENWVELAQQKG
ncbi:MAG TPA: type I-C CRISPR-associated protein Cas7/Csd2 [Sediminispirochaeta sp.]|nr:type I-C CRISPR-associated protein Cas7/Csd2 [Sediminispirochaeta sp.]